MSKSITKRKSNETMKQELLNSLQDNDDVEKKGLKERSNKVSNSQEATIIIRRYEDIIKTEIKKS